MTSAEVTGHWNWWRRFDSDDFRQASSGPTPVRNSKARPIGIIHLLKNGGPTVIRTPVTASLIVGNSVANRIKNAEKSRIQLFNKNAASRDTQDSRSLRARRSGIR